MYSKHILPKVVHLTRGMKPIMRQREKVVPLARGLVSAVGVGSGLNLPFYDRSKVTRVCGLDLSVSTGSSPSVNPGLAAYWPSTMLTGPVPFDFSAHAA